jgi:hypothetical protein
MGPIRHLDTNERGVRLGEEKKAREQTLDNKERVDDVDEFFGQEIRDGLLKKKGRVHVSVSPVGEARGVRG